MMMKAEGALMNAHTLKTSGSDNIPCSAVIKRSSQRNPKVHSGRWIYYCFHFTSLHV